MHRVHRRTAVLGGLQQARSNRLPSAVSVRSPPYEARASSRPRSRANQDVTFRGDQALRSHRLVYSTLRFKMRYGETNGQNYQVVCSYRADNGRLPSSAAATARASNDDEFMGAIGRIHYDLRFELCWLCQA